MGYHVGHFSREKMGEEARLEKIQVCRRSKPMNERHGWFPLCQRLIMGNSCRGLPCIKDDGRRTRVPNLGGPAYTGMLHRPHLMRLAEESEEMIE